jgi:outer membrane receptor protein involved in Fe transport
MKTLLRLSAALALATATWAGGSRAALAQDVEVPILVVEQAETEDTGESDDQLDLANLVTSAAKGVTTVQEAPAIVTILPGDEIKDRHGRTLEDILDGVPGFLKYDAHHGQFSFAATRGVIQGMLYLRDGFSMFDTWTNVPSLGRQTPVETIKRIEIVSGPGGVLWGANSYLGLINVIYKDAEDIDGIEANLSYGDGPGDKLTYRGYVLAGDPELFGRDGYKLVVHASYESFIGPTYTRPQHMFSTPLPNPNSTFIYGPARTTNQPASTIINFDGKLTLGKVNVHWSIPYVDRYYAMGFPGSLSTGELPEDSLREGDTIGMNGQVVRDPSSALECTPLPTAKEAADAADRCIDRQRASRTNSLNYLDRYVAVEYRSRFSATSGISVKGYFVDLDRTMPNLMILMPIGGLLEGGLSFDTAPEVYRAGMSVDGDVDVTKKFRALWGFEAFHEWLRNTVERARGGPGTEASFPAPYDLSRLPFACPRSATGIDAMGKITGVDFLPGCPVNLMFDVSRTTVGAFAAAQYRPSTRLILDGGVRLQASPEIASNSRGYGLNPTVSVAAVYEFVTDWHFKLNFAQGFRAPVFNNTDSNGDAVEIDGDRNLPLERSQAYQAEVNARLLKGRKRIRELGFRADYSYSILENFVTFSGGRYVSGGKRGIHSAELLAKLYLKGGHRVELGWTWADISTADKGEFLSVPEHWFSLLGVAQLVPDKLQLSTMVKIYGAMEDPNRRVEARDLAFDPVTGNADQAKCYGCANVTDPQTVKVEPYELVVDRLPPAAELQLGVRWNPVERLTLSGTVYNTFANKHYSLDAFNDLAPRLEILPTTYEDFRFLTQATYTF